MIFSLIKKIPIIIPTLAIVNTAILELTKLKANFTLKNQMSMFVRL